MTMGVVTFLFQGSKLLTRKTRPVSAIKNYHSEAFNKYIIDFSTKLSELHSYKDYNLLQKEMNSSLFSLISSIGYYGPSLLKIPPPIPTLSCAEQTEEVEQTKCASCQRVF